MRRIGRECGSRSIDRSIWMLLFGSQSLGLGLTCVAYAGRALEKDMRQLFLTGDPFVQE